MDQSLEYDQNTEDITIFLAYKGAKDFLIKEGNERVWTLEAIKERVFG